MENVKLRFTDDALEAIAEEALARKIGARGLRTIIEEMMLDVMYRPCRPTETSRAASSPAKPSNEAHAPIAGARQAQAGNRQKTA